MQRVFSVLAALVFALGSPANFVLATDYFVINNGGPTSGDGSAGSPWGTITEALGSGVLLPGDVVNVAAGTYTNLNGEVFPLPVRPGVSLAGAGAGQTVVQGFAAPIAPALPVLVEVGYVVTMDEPLSMVAEPTILRDMTLSALASSKSPVAAGLGSSPWMAVIHADLVPVDFQVLDNELNGAGFGLLYGSPMVGAQQLAPATWNLTVTGNTIQGFDNAGVMWDIWTSSLGSGAVIVADNTISGGRLGIQLDFFVGRSTIAPASDSGADLVSSGVINAEVSRNVLESQSWTAIDALFVALGGSGPVAGGPTLDYGLLVESNSAHSPGMYGIHVTAGHSGFGFVSGSAALKENVVENAGAGGILLNAVAAGSAGVERMLGGHAFVAADLEFNTVMGAGGDGIGLAAIASGGGPSAEVDAALAFNLVEGCSGNGMFLDALAGYSSSEAAANGERGIAGPVLNADLRGNRVALNEENGVVLRSAGFGSASCAADMGHLAPDFGRNTIQQNAGDYQNPGFYDVLLSCTQDVPAIGNWWGTTDTGVIEDHVWHGPDSGGYAFFQPRVGTTAGTLDFSCPLFDPLTFEVDPDVFSNLPGTPVSLIAGDKSAFVGRIGNREIALTLNGVQAANVQVDETPGSPLLAAGPGGRLSFEVPFGVPAGVIDLFVKNAGAQTGTNLAIVIQRLSLKDVSRCFIATAAYGDGRAPEVLLLRRWRDECLASNPLGRQLVKAYYALSPGLAERVSGSVLARGAARAALTPVVGAVRLWMEAPWAFGALGLLFAWRLLRRRR